MQEGQALFALLSLSPPADRRQLVFWGGANTEKTHKAERVFGAPTARQHIANTAPGGARAPETMRSPLGHNYSLDHASLARSLVHLGDPSRFQRLHADLQAGRPLTVGVIGASVAQNGGCINQPGQRCMFYNGRVPVRMEAWNDRRLHKGFAVRLVDLLNATWPRSRPTLVNAAQDATPAQNTLPCLFTHLPRHVGLVVIEFGSLALHLRMTAAEAIVRKLLGIRPPPVIVFLTIRGLCKRTKQQTPETIRYTLGSHWELYTRSDVTAWSRAEQEFGKLCVHYGLSCLSLFEATHDHMLARRPGFTLQDVSLDCLHPSLGRFGTDYLFDLLVNWLERGLGLRAEERRLRRGLLPAKETGAVASLPDPMHALNRHPAPDGVCYTFGERGKKRSAISQRMANIEWSTAQCRDDAPRLHDADALLHDEISCEPVNQTGCPGSSPRRHLAPRPGFGFCDRALGGRGAGKEGGKISPGTLALMPGARNLALRENQPARISCLKSLACAKFGPGALLEFAPDTRVQASGAAEDPQYKVQAGLEYLISYEGMGRSLLRCVRHCSCKEQRLDAHSTSRVHNESVFVRHFFTIRGASARCSLSLLLLNESSSGGHKFKVRSLFIASGDGGAQRLWQRMDRPDMGT